MTDQPIDRTPKKPNSPPDPVVISWSGLKRWENCPQHQLRTIRKETAQSEKGRIFLPGTVLDLTQRRWLDSDDPLPGQMHEIVVQVFDEVVDLGESKIRWNGSPTEDRKNIIRDLQQDITVLEPWLIKNVLPFSYQAEVKFRAHMEIPYLCEGMRAPVKMIGGIDIVVQDDDGKFHLYDLKRTKDPSYIRSTLAQLIFYDTAWGIIQGDFNHAVEWGFVAPALPELLIPITVDHDDRRLMMSRIIKYAQGVWRDEWSPKANDTGCNWCEARGVCDKFKVIPIVDENGKQRVSFMQAAAQRSQFRADTSDGSDAPSGDSQPFISNS